MCAVFLNPVCTLQFICLFMFKLFRDHSCYVSVKNGLERKRGEAGEMTGSNHKNTGTRPKTNFNSSNGKYPEVFLL
jgi:hypothetical protein